MANALHEPNGFGERLLSAIADAQRRFIADAPAEEVFDRLLSNLLNITNSEYGFIGEVETGASGAPVLMTHAITNVAWDQASAEIYEGLRRRELRFENMETLFGAAIMTGEPVIANEVAADPRASGVPNGHPPLRAFLGLPFVAHQSVIGMVGLANRQGGYSDAFVTQLEPLVATCTRLVLAYQDAARRRAAEKALRSSEQQVRGLLEQAADGIFLADEDGNYLEVNQRGCDLVGYRREELLQLNLRDLLPDSEIQRLPARLDELGSGKALLTERRLRRADGSILEAELSSRRLEDGSLLAIVRDVSERVRRQAQLEHTERIATIGTLVSSVAHEINTPMTYLLLHLESMADEIQALRRVLSTDRTLPASDAANRLDALGGDTQTALEAAHRVRDIIRDLRSFSWTAEPTHSEAIDVIASFDAAQRLVANRLGPGIELSVAPFPDLPRVNANENRLAQVFLNLLMNAIDAVEAGENSRQVGVRAYKGEREVVVEVEDDGFGIPDEVRARMFEPFFSTKASGKGSGLGLAVSHDIIAAYGGRLELSSRPGRTVFAVHLPIAEPIGRPAERANPEPPAPADLEILVVDDDAPITSILSSILKGHHRITVAKSAEEAKLLTKGGALFDIVLCDILMPECSGTELHTWFLGHRPDLAARTIFMTAGVHQPEVESYLRGSEIQCLNKPFTRKSVLDSIASVAASTPRAAPPSA